MRLPARRPRARGGRVRGRHRRRRPGGRDPGLGAEAGAEGHEIAGRLAVRAAECDIAVAGPDSMGIATPGGLSLWLGTVAGPESFVPGHVACVAHSGSIARGFLAAGPRVGFRTVISAGGELSRDLADFVAHLAGDEGTKAIGLFVEAIRRPEAFAAALALAAEAGKPVVCLKVGRSQGAARAALAHSGAVVGSSRAFSALLRHHGALEVTDFHELLETLEVLGRRRWPRRLASRASRSRAANAGCWPTTARSPASRSRHSTKASRRASSRPSPTSRCRRTRSTAGPSTTPSASIPAASRSCATRVPTTSCSRRSTSRATAAKHDEQWCGHDRPSARRRGRRD